MSKLVKVGLALFGAIYLGNVALLYFQATSEAAEREYYQALAAKQQATRQNAIDRGIIQPEE